MKRMKGTSMPLKQESPPSNKKADSLDSMKESSPNSNNSNNNTAVPRGGGKQDTRARELGEEERYQSSRSREWRSRERSSQHKTATHPGAVASPQSKVAAKPQEVVAIEMGTRC